MVMIHHRVEDGRGNLVEEWDEEEDPRKTKRRRLIADGRAFAIDVNNNPGNYSATDILQAKLWWLMCEGFDE